MLYHILFKFSKLFSGKGSQANWQGIYTPVNKKRFLRSRAASLVQVGEPLYDIQIS
ncbi:hypothetical protein [Methanosarcina sp. DH2]|uniref:hypothetical protein n=1 Tax=Methanosarcina sp. DH2 TaxID=2605639 RepID=UPI001E30A580|nr:hypothetical protein [Methanosarcina sp. DH2]